MHFTIEHLSRPYTASRTLAVHSEGALDSLFPQTTICSRKETQASRLRKSDSRFPRMSNCICNQPPSPKPSVGGTLTGGIQDVSAILPIIGTNQCETHVGSALTGGFLYAAAAPLSIFGCLGIIKVAIGILIASISIPKFWVSHNDVKPSGSNGKGKQSMFFGAELLQNTGFQLAGNVAPLIGMDGTRFKSESRLIEILEEKHINDPDHVSITWKSKQWNIMLVLFTIIAAAMSSIPYVALLIGPRSWRPTTHLPWLFPFLRTAGSCLASVCCQFIIQSRVISTMKNRILFMTIHRYIEHCLLTDNKENLDDWLKFHLQWDSNLPAEQCIRNIGQVLSSYEDISQIVDDVQATENHILIDMEQENLPPTRWISWMYTLYRRSPTPPALPPPKPLFQNFTFNRRIFEYWLRHHFPSPKRDRAIAFISWVLLSLSLPATIAGYVGCFTLVSATPSPGNGPLVWLGLEAALSIIRILIWAWNPKFDEDTDITVDFNLNNHGQSDWNEELNDFIEDLENKESKSLPLHTEQQFLDALPTYNGPFAKLRRFKDIALHYTLMADDSIRLEDAGTRYTTLLITVTDFNTGLGVTLLHLGGSFYYFDAEVKQDAARVEENAIVSSTMRNIYPWKKQMGLLFDALERHYKSIVNTLNQAEGRRAILYRTWDLSVKQILTTQPSSERSFFHGLLYPNHRYEHTQKTLLIQLWSRWITSCMENMEIEARKDCYEALENDTSEKAKWELTELDRLLAEEWVLREQVLVAYSLELENILWRKIEKSITQLGTGQEAGKLKVWMKTGFVLSKRKRLENDRGEAKKRMKEAMDRASVRAERERQSWKEQDQFAPKWQEGIEFIDALWSEGISEKPTGLKHVEAEIETSARMDTPDDFEGTPRHNFVAQVAQRFKYWRSQREYERREMEATIERIRSVDGQRDQLDSAYKYPGPDKEAPHKFVSLRQSCSNGKACSAIVYDASYCSADIVYDVVKKDTTRSVINVDPNIVASIPPNNHLFFLSCYKGNGEEPAFVQQNRDRWWNQQTSNSAFFYFTPYSVYSGRGYSCCISSSGPIAQILISLTTPSRIRLRLLHCADNNPTISISVQQNGKDLFTLSDGIPRDNFKLQTLEIGKLRPGRHKLQVVAYIPGFHYYYLRDILIDLLDCPAESSSTSQEKDQTKEILPVIDTVPGGEQESVNSPVTPLTILNGQNLGSEDHTVIRIPSLHI